MGSGGRVSDEHRRLLEDAGYQWNKQVDAWTNRHAGRAISGETVAKWSAAELREWLAKGAAT